MTFPFKTNKMSVAIRTTLAGSFPTSAQEVKTVHALLNSRFTQHRRFGFTLIEMLVVIAAIGLLVGLLLPAVQAARSAARRISCYNNLKQLGLALHNYESALRALPSGYVYNFGVGGNQAGFGWGAVILPYMEQSSVYQNIDFKVPVFNLRNAVIREMHLASFLCPEDFIW